MNDIGYLNTPYRDSVCKKVDDGCKDLEQLELRLQTSKVAYQFHIEQSNPKQAALFRESIENLKTKIKKIETK